MNICEQCSSSNTVFSKAGYNSALVCNDCGYEEHQPEWQERQLLEREPNGTDSLNAGCALLAMLLLLFWLIVVPLLLIFT